jgi:hypothetical protein
MTKKVAQKISNGQKWPRSVDDKKIAQKMFKIFQNKKTIQKFQHQKLTQNFFLFFLL